MQKRAMRVTRSDPQMNLCRLRVGRVQILGSVRVMARSTVDRKRELLLKTKL